MKRKLLFIAPDYYGFNEVVLKGLKEYSDCDVSYIVSNFKYQYKNWGERIYNFFLKTLLGRDKDGIFNNIATLEKLSPL